MYLLLGFELNVMLFQDDCLDNSDEDDELCRNLINRHQCPDESMFDCNVTDLMTCIPRRWTCDGKFDCPNGNDEAPQQCINATSSGPHKAICENGYYCGSNSSTSCIIWSQVCFRFWLPSSLVLHILGLWDSRIN